MAYFRFAPYVSVAERRAEAAREVKRRAKRGEVLAPVVIEGRKVAHTVWGLAWCEHIEDHADVSNRLPRGLTYVRNGSVIDLRIAPGQISALVSGSSIYTVRVTVQPMQAARWEAIASACVGHIDSLVDLLQGRLDRGVMTRLCHPTEGIFPRARELRFECSCPDGAALCKHVAATLYGVGHRLDTRPELLFTLRQVDQAALVPQVAALAIAGPSTPTLADDGLGALFGLEFEAGPIALPAPPATPDPQAAVRAEVHAFLAESPELEFPLSDIFTYQTARPRRSRKALRAALDALVAEGRIALSDVEDGIEYWIARPTGQ